MVSTSFAGYLYKIIVSLHRLLKPLEIFLFKTLLIEFPFFFLVMKNLMKPVYIGSTFYKKKNVIAVHVQKGGHVLYVKYKHCCCLAASL